jgi:Alternative complex III, ActD subunit
MKPTETPAIYGLMAEFPDPTSLVQATERTHKEGYRKIDAYTPFPIHELVEAFDAHDHRVQRNVLVGGIAGMLGGFGLCYWVSTMAYPLNVGGRPYNSWPSFIPVTFELTILLASFAAVLSWILLSGLPMPYHPVFNVPKFAQTASENGFFLTIESADPKFDRQGTVEFLKSLGAKEINEIPA